MTTTDVKIVPIETPTLGNRTYVVHDGEVAFVVDPQRDIDRVLGILDEHGVRLTDVFETHIHNDYVTGGLALAKRTGAAYHVNADDDVSFDRTPIRDGDTVQVGSRMLVTAIATPGHTFTHLSYGLNELAPTETATGIGSSVCVFSGGSLLFGATGRPDLLGEEHADTLARHQHASAHKLADLLPGDADVFPTHGFGSFCAATQSDSTESTIDQERESNPVLTQDEADYVRELLDGLGAWPSYYVHMMPMNAEGRPNRTCPRRRLPTPSSCAAASRPGNGSWTCATVRPSRPDTRRVPSTSGSRVLSPPTWVG
ncbi:MBL fold metallo-hydrolase [Aeromicrobium sp.]|uniref:MBL fold metallo-hydrolase n=1 Tax=Aeromicrobium sp. TaxID=1871063 RepID=UPI0030BE11E0